MINLSKLMPAPWRYELNRVLDGTPQGECDEVAELFFPGEANSFLQSWNPKKSDETALEFAALARNAFDAQERRRWWLMPVKNGWMISIRGNVIAEWPPDLSRVYGTLIESWAAIVEADRWLAEKEKANAQA